MYSCVEHEYLYNIEAISDAAFRTDMKLHRRICVQARKVTLVASVL